MNCPLSISLKTLLKIGFISYMNFLFVNLLAFFCACNELYKKMNVKVVAKSCPAKIQV